MTKAHDLYNLALRDRDMLPTIAIGAAGTGKTYGGIGAAVEWLKTRSRQLIVTRPNVSFADKNGFLPGSEREKMGPWVRPIEQNLRLHGVSVPQQESWEKHGTLQFLPLEYIQGLTFDNAFILVDECFRDGAEILTDRGFVDFKELTELDMVAQYDSDGVITFVKPSRRITKPYSGKLVTMESANFYSSVTPNHRRIFKDSCGVIKDVLAKDGFLTSWKIPRCGKKSGGHSVWSDDFVALACMLQADGHANKKRGNYYWQVSVKKERKILRIRELLQSCGVNYVEYSKDSSGRVRFYLGRLDRLLSGFLEEGTKTFSSRAVLSMAYDGLRTFYDNLIFWDGSLSGGHVMYGTTNLDNANLAQAVGHLLNKTANISRSEDSRKASYKEYFRVYFSDNEGTTTQKKRDTYEDYDGLVHCVTVPSGMIVVRQRGCVQVSGNCQNMTFEQLKVLLTRQGKYSKLVLCGDIAQISPRFQGSGLAKLIDMVRVLDLNVHLIEFTHEDILRSKQCAEWIMAFDKYEGVVGGQVHP